MKEQLIKQFDDYLNNCNLDKIKLIELSDILKAIKNNPAISLAEICEAVITFSETLPVENPTQVELHNLLHDNAQDDYFAALAVCEKKLDFLAEIKIFMKEDGIDYATKKEFKNLLREWKDNQYPVLSMCSHLIAWSDREDNYLFELDEKVEFKKVVCALLQKHFPVEYAKAQLFAITEKHEILDVEGVKEAAQFMGFSEMCSGLYAALKIEKDEAFIKHVWALDREFWLKKQQREPNESPLKDFGWVSEQFWYAIADKPLFETLCQSFSVAFKKYEDLQHFSAVKVLEDFSEWSKRQLSKASDPEIRRVLLEFNFKLSVCMLIEKSVAHCSGFVLDKIRENMLKQNDAHAGFESLKLLPFLTDQELVLIFNVQKAFQRYQAQLKRSHSSSTSSCASHFGLSQPVAAVVPNKENCKPGHARVFK